MYKFSKNLLLLPFYAHPERQECPVSACYVRITTEEIRNVVVIEELNCAWFLKERTTCVRFKSSLVEDHLSSSKIAWRVFTKIPSLLFLNWASWAVFETISSTKGNNSFLRRSCRFCKQNTKIVRHFSHLPNLVMISKCRKTGNGNKKWTTDLSVGS